MMTHRDTATDFKKTATALEMAKDKLRKMGRDASDESVAAMMRRASDERRAGKIINVGKKEDSGLLSVKEKDPAYEAMRRLLKK
jgi:vacuolar-type H+-ATPase subunit E/Vma4